MPTGSKPEASALAVEVGAVLRGWMARRGVTQASLSEATDISQSQLSKLLRGERVLDLDQVFAFSAALGVSALDVIAEAERASSPAASTPHATTVTARDIAAGSTLPLAPAQSHRTRSTGTTRPRRT